MSKDTIKKLETVEKEITKCDWCDRSIEGYKGETFVSNKKRVDICDECMELADPKQMNKEKNYEEISPHMFEKSQVETIVRETQKSLAFYQKIWLVFSVTLIGFIYMLSSSILAIGFPLIFSFLVNLVILFVLNESPAKEKNPEKYLRQ